MTNTPKHPSVRVKPTLETKFHIDYSWWERPGNDLHAYLVIQLPLEQQPLFEAKPSGEAPKRDWIDPQTGEVLRLDALNMAIQSAARDPQFIHQGATLVDKIFRAFLANGNKPLNIQELATLLHRNDPPTILKTLAGTPGTVYKGLRPLIEE